uniref:WRC domain-containing protein n=1 Tax=Oryza punctata TaxID=4537 RepID=A0A0E0JZV7_ORYPU
MRIRRAASRVLGSTYFTTQSEASPASVSNLTPTSSVTVPVAYGGGDDLGGLVVTPEGACQLSLSPWDLPYELEDPNPLEAPFDRYMECIPYRASFMSDSDNDDEMQVEDKIWDQVENEEVNDQQPDHKVNQGGEVTKMKGKMNESMVVKEMEDIDKQASVWYCNKNDGKKWHCRNIVNGPKTLCDYHLRKSRSYYTRTGETGAAASSKSSRAKAPAIAKTAMPKSSSKRTPTGESSARNNSFAAAAASSVSVLPTISQSSKRKAANGLGGDAYYFYDMFVPYRKKDRGGSSNHQVDAEKKEILPQDNAVVMEEKVVYNSSDYSSDTASDDESDEDYIVGGASKRHTKKGKMKLSVKKVQFSKMMKKRVKERSLKSCSLDTVPPAGDLIPAMRLRRAATRVLGPANSTTQARGSRASSNNLSSELVMYAPAMHGGGGGLDIPVVDLEGACSLNQSPWDLACELENSNPLEDLFDKYLVHIPHRASFTFNNDNDDEMEVYDKIWKRQQANDEDMKDLNPSQKEKQDGETRMVKGHMNVEPLVPEVMFEKGIEDFDEKKASVWYYHKNDGKRWHCQNIIDGPKASCEYHLAKSYSNNPTREKVATASSKSSRTKASTITMPALPKSSSKATLTSEPSRLRAASASIAKNSRSHKRKAGNGLGEDAYYSYSLFKPFHGKDEGDSSKGRVATNDYQQKGFLQQDNTVLIKQKDENNKYIDVTMGKAMKTTLLVVPTIPMLRKGNNRWQRIRQNDDQEAPQRMVSQIIALEFPFNDGSVSISPCCLIYVLCMDCGISHFCELFNLLYL